MKFKLSAKCPTCSEEVNLVMDIDGEEMLSVFQKFIGENIDSDALSEAVNDEAVTIRLATEEDEEDEG